MASNGRASMNAPTELWVAAAWAGLIAIDHLGIGPWHVAQPLVSGPLLGWLLGDVQSGVILGVLVQLLWIGVAPGGVGIPYDFTAATMLAVFWSRQQPGHV